MQIRTNTNIIAKSIPILLLLMICVRDNKSIPNYRPCCYAVAVLTFGDKIAMAVRHVVVVRFVSSAIMTIARMMTRQKTKFSRKSINK